MTQSLSTAETMRTRGLNAHLVGLAIAGGIVVLTVMVAFFWPPTYVARATVALEPKSVSATEALGKMSETEVAAKLHKSVVSDNEVKDLAREMLAGTGSDDRDIQRIRDAVRVVPDAPRTYRVEFRGSDALQVERVTNEIARRVVARAAAELGIAPERAAQESNLERRTRELADFVAAHPELALDAPESPAADAKPKETATDILRKEQAQLEALLARAERARNAKSDNPYTEPLPTPEQVRARLAHVKEAIGKREQAQQTAKPVSASPELQAEWQRLVKALAAARKESSPPAPSQPGLVAKVVAPAPVPERPERPNRLLILALGCAMAAAWYALCLVLGALKKKSTQAPQAGLLQVAGHAPVDEAVRGPLIAPIAPIRPIAPRTAPLEAPAAPMGGIPPEAIPAIPPLAPPHQQPAAGEHFQYAPHQGQRLPPTDHVTRTSSRPPPGAGAYSVSVHEPGSDPPPPEQLTPLRNHDSGHRTRTPPRNNQAPSAQESNASTAPDSVSPMPSARGSRVRRPMKRTVTLIHGSFIDPDGVPAAVDNSIGIDTTGISLDPPEPSFDDPVPPKPEQPQPTANRAPVLKVNAVPVGSAWSPNVPRATGNWLDNVRSDVFARALHQFDGRCFVVMVTGSARARDLKSQAAAQLALALAESGHPRILLVEGDFDRPMVHHILAVEMPRYEGFSQQMNARIHGETRERWTVVECRPTLHVLAEGRLLTPGLLNSYQFDAAVNELKRYYEIILISAPPLSLTTDLRALDTVADGVIVVEDKGSAPLDGDPSVLFGQKLIARVVAKNTR